MKNTFSVTDARILGERAMNEGELGKRILKKGNGRIGYATIVAIKP
jgi:hypothetical protein